MNGTYALIESSTGLVVNTIVLGEPVDWTPPDGFFVIKTDSASTGWSYINGEFIPPPVPPLTPDEIWNKNRAELSQRTASASQSMMPIIMALNLEDTTDGNVVAAKAWQDYYLALQAVDLSVESPAWPEPPELL